MNHYRCFLLIFCFFISINTIFGQKDSTLIIGNEEDQVLFYEKDRVPSNANIVGPFMIMKQEGYIINYFYRKGDEFYNYNIIFVPLSELTVPLIKDLTDKSVLANKGLLYTEQYLIFENDTAVFEDIFKYSWVIMHVMGKENDSLWDRQPYNSEEDFSLNFLTTEVRNNTPSKEQNEMLDSLRIVFKLLKVEGIFKLCSYNIDSQTKHNNFMFSWTSYFEPQKAIKLQGYEECKMCRLDYRFISPIFARVITLEFKDRKIRKRIKYFSK